MPQAPTLGLVDRLMALMEGVAGPMHVLYWVELSACPDAPALEAALRELVLAEPILASRLVLGRWGPRRLPWSPEAQGWPSLLALAERGDAQALPRFRADPLPLAEGPPLRLLLRPEADGRCLLVLKLHHAASDATGGLGLLHALAARLQGPSTALAPLGLLPQGSPFWRLPWGQRFGVLGAAWRESARGLTQGGQAYASLVPLPSAGPARHVALRLGAPQVAVLRAKAQAQGASLNELLMAQVLHALALDLPPDQAALPFVAHMAVSLREGGDAALGNRVADVRLAFEVAQLQAGPHSALRAVQAQCAPARANRRVAIARLFERMLASRVPTASFRRIIASFMARPRNQVMTLDWSNLGEAGPVPGPFGPGVAGLAASFLPPLSTPPGLAVAIATLGGQLTLSLSYAEGPVAPAQAEAWLRRVGEGLKQAAGGALTGPL